MKSPPLEPVSDYPRMTLDGEVIFPSFRCKLGDRDAIRKFAYLAKSILTEMVEISPEEFYDTMRRYMEKGEISPEVWANVETIRKMTREKIQKMIGSPIEPEEAPVPEIDPLKDLALLAMGYDDIREFKEYIAKLENS